MLTWVSGPSNQQIVKQNQLGEVQASVGIGGGLLWLAILGLAGYGFYQLVK